MDQPNINPSEQNTNREPVISPNNSNLSNSSNKSNPFLKIIIVILLLVIFLAGGIFLGKTYFSPQTPIAIIPTIAPIVIPPADPTADWKTYQSKCNLEFKYPSLWKIEPYFISDSNNACGYLKGQDYKESLDSRTGTYITLSRYLLGKDNINSIEDYVHSSEKVIQPKPQQIKPMDKTHGGFNGKEFTGYGYDPGISFAFIEGKHIYDINRSEETPIDYINQILSTFKFIQ